MEVSEITSVAKSIWLGSRNLRTGWAAWLPCYLFLSGTSDEASLCFSLWKVLISSHHSVRDEDGKKRNITWDCKTASSSLRNGKWDKIHKLYVQSLVQLGSIHLPKHRLWVPFETQQGTWDTYMGMADEKNLCLAGVTASVLTRYLQGFQTPQNTRVWQLHRTAHFFHSGSHCLCPTNLFQFREI